MNWILGTVINSPTARIHALPEILTNQTTIEFQINMVRRRQCRRNGESLGRALPGRARPLDPWGPCWFVQGKIDGETMGDPIEMVFLWFLSEKNLIPSGELT